MKSFMYHADVFLGLVVIGLLLNEAYYHAFLKHKKDGNSSDETASSGSSGGSDGPVTIIKIPNKKKTKHSKMKGRRKKK